MRGEYVFDLFEFSAIMGSPPHARGILRLPICHHHQSGITPACAGNTKALIGMIMRGRDHPRMRGEYACVELKQAVDRGLPPHARGIPMAVL